LTWVAIATGAVGWAIWYDRKRTSHPDYKKNLVEKRRSELIEKRKKEDPFYLVNTIELLPDKDINNPTAIQTFTMKMIQEGETLLEGGKQLEGCSYIAVGLSYMPHQQFQQTLMQLQQGLPREIVMKIGQLGAKSRARVQQQRMSVMMGQQNSAKNAGGDTKEIEEKPAAEKETEDIGPEDVDSIDGDTEEKIVELDSSDDEQEDLKNDENEDKQEEAPKPETTEPEPKTEETVEAPKVEETTEVVQKAEEVVVEQAAVVESEKEEDEEEEEEVKNDEEEIDSQEPEVMREREPEIVKQEEIEQAKQEMLQNNKSDSDNDTDAENEQIQSSEQGDEDELD